MFCCVSKRHEKINFFFSVEKIMNACHQMKFNPVKVKKSDLFADNRCMKKVKNNNNNNNKNWIREECSEIKENLGENNSKRAGERIDHSETGESDYCPRSFRKMPHRRAIDTEPMDRLLL